MLLRTVAPEPARNTACTQRTFPRAFQGSQVPRRKVRHICDVQVSNLFTADEGREARATYWYRLEAATDTGPWATFYTSEEVPGDLDLRWDPLGSLLSDIACQPYPRTAPPTTSSPAAPAPGLLGLAPADDAQQAQQDACFGECDRVRVTLFARRGVRSSNAAPASTLQQSRDGRAARQQSVVLTPAPASGPLQASGHVPALPRAAVAEPEGTGEDTGGVATGQASATAHTAGPQAAPEPVPAIASQPPSPAGEATDDQLDSNRASEGLTVLVSITVGQGGTCEVSIVLQPQHSVTANGICSPAACQPSAEPAQSSHTQTRAPASDGCASSPAQTAFSQPAEPPSAHKSLAQQGACNTDGSTQEGHRAALETPKQQDAAAQLSPQPTMTDWVGNGPAPGHTQSKQAQSAINDDDDTFIVCQLQFRSSDLIAVDMETVFSSVHGINLFIFRTTDRRTCLPASVTVLHGLSFTAPLPLLHHAALEPFPQDLLANTQNTHTGSGSMGAAGPPLTLPDTQVAGESVEYTDVGKEGVYEAQLATEVAQSQIAFLDGNNARLGMVAQSQIVLWMADSGSVITPLGLTHTASPALSDQINTAQLVSEAVGGLAGSANQGLMPSMMAMLFGPGAVAQRTTNGTSAPASVASSAQRGAHRRQHSVTLGAHTITLTGLYQNRHMHRPSSPGPTLQDLHRTSGPTVLMHASRTATPSATTPTRGVRDASAVALPPLPPVLAPSASGAGGAGSKLASGASTLHRRSASASAFVSPTAAASLAAALAAPGPLGAGAAAAAAHAPSRLQVRSRNGDSTPEAWAAAAARAGYSPAGLSPLAGAVGERMGEFHTGADTAQCESPSSTAGTNATTRHTRVYDVEDLQSSTRRLMAAHRRLMSMRAARQRMQQHLMKVLSDGDAALCQQRALDVAQADLTRATDEAVALQRKASVLRARAEMERTRLEQRLRDGQAASKQVKASRERLSAAQETLAGSEGWGTWRALHAQVAGRVNELVASLAAAYELGPRGASIRLARPGVAADALLLLPHPSPSLHTTHPTHTTNPPSNNTNPQQQAHKPPPHPASVHAARTPTGTAAQSMQFALQGSPKRTGVSGGMGPIHRPSPSLDDVLAAQPLERTMDASWWMAGMGEVAKPDADSPDGSVNSSDLDDIIQRVLTGPTPAARHSRHPSSDSLPRHPSHDNLSSANTPTHTTKPPLPRQQHTTNAITTTTNTNSVTNSASANNQSGGGSAWLPGSLAELKSKAVFAWASQQGKPSAGPRPAGPVALCVLGLEVPGNLAKRTLEGGGGWVTSPDEEQRIAAALGYVAHMVDRLSVYMDVPLRYPVLPAMSRSHIWDPCPALTPTNAASGTLVSRTLQRIFGASAAPADHTSAASVARSNPSQWLLGSLPSGLLRSTDTGDGSASPHATGGTAGVVGGRADLPALGLSFGQQGGANPEGRLGGVVLPLYADGRDRTRFAYAVYLLNKDVELLMQAYGLASAGPNHLLRNLYTLALAALAV